jgi:nucleoside-diphosphate-sugar epimerase
MSSKRYLVTGGAGFIGSNIAEALLARGDSVTVLDDFSTGKTSNLEALRGNVDVVRGSVCDSEAVAKALKDVDGVFHLAAVASVTRSIEAPVVTDLVNAHGVLVVLDEARRAGVRKLTFSASSAAYGDDPSLPKHEDMRPLPISTYGASKVAGEHHVHVFSKLHGMQAVALRYFNVFGPRQDPKGEYAAAIPRFVAAFLAGKRPTIFGDGQQTRDFCHVSDVVRANLLAIDTPAAAGEAINIARGESVTIRDLVSMIAAALGVRANPEFAALRAGDIVHSSADISKAHRLLGFVPEVSLSEGLRETVEYFRAQTGASS